MKNVHRAHIFILIAIFSIATGAYGQTEKIIGKGHVQAIEFSSDGKWLAIGTSAILELYSTKTYQTVYVIEANVHAIDFSPDGVEMTIAVNQALRRLDIPTGREIETLEGHEHQISDVAYSPNGEMIASIDIRGVSRLWRRGEEIATFWRASSRRGDFSLLFSPNGKQLIIGAFGVEIWEIADEQLVNEWHMNSRVTTLALHPDGIQLAIGTEGGQIEFWSLQTGERTEVIDGRDVEIELPRSKVEVDSLAFGPDGKTLVVGFRDSVIAVWDVASQRPIRSWIAKTKPNEEFKGWGVHTGGPDYEVRSWPPSLALSRDGHTVVALADRFANVGRWEVETGKLIGRFESYSTYPRMLGFSADASRFATLSGVVRVWDTETAQVIAEMQYDNGGSAAALSPNGKYVAITHGDRRITVWDVDTATVKHVLRGSIWGGIWYWTVAFSPDSRLVAAVTVSPIIRVWEVETGELIAELNHWGDELSFNFVRFSPDGKWLAGGGHGIAIWETEGFALHRIIRETDNLQAGSITFSPNSQWLVGYTGIPPDKTLFWNIETGKVDLELPTGIAITAEFSPDGRWLVTGKWGTEQGGYEPAMKFWDVETGRLILDLPRPSYLHAIFSPDGKTIAIGHDDRRVHLLPIEAVLPQAVAVEPKGLRLFTLGRIKENALFQNYPNPFNPETWIPYQLVIPSPVRIHIYNLMGHRVRILELGQRQAGVYLDRNRAAYWDGRNEQGEAVSSGVYVYQLQMNDYSAVKRLVVLK